MELRQWAGIAGVYLSRFERVHSDDAPQILSLAFTAWYGPGDEGPLAASSDTCLPQP